MDCLNECCLMDSNIDGDSDQEEEKQQYQIKYKMHAACKEGDLSKVRELYKGPIDWVIRDSEGRNPLACAVKHGHLNIVQFFLEQAGNINSNNNFETRTTLHYACEEGVVDIVQWLLENGANVNSIDGSGEMPIHRACQITDRGKRVDIIKRLLELGADATAPLKDGTSPLTTAFEEGDIALVKLFLEYKYDFYKNYLDCKFKTPLMLAVKCRHEELISYLIEVGGVDFKDRYKIGFDSLALACTTNDLDYIKFICKAVYNDQLPDETKSRAIHTAAMEYNDSVLEFLLEMGCGIEARNYYMETPLMSAILCDQQENAEQLWGKEADSEAARCDGKTVKHLYGEYISKDSWRLDSIYDYESTDLELRTPLHCAIRACSKYGIEKMVDYSNLEAVDCNQRTMLHYLCATNNLDWMQYFAEEVVRKVDIEARDEKKRTALHLAAENKSFIPFAFLIANGADISAVSDDKGTVLQHALASCRKYNFQLSLALGAEINIANKEGKTPLHYAAYYCTDTLKKLLDKGADVHAIDNSGLTPLHCACQRDCNAIDLAEKYRRPEETAASYLIKRGANNNARDKYGRTPLHLAYKHERFSTIKYLILNGADKNAVDNDGRNILHYAAQSQDSLDEDSLFHAELNVPDKRGHRPIFYASRTDILKYLISRTADIKPDEFRNYFPHLLLDLDGLKMVFERGANIDAIDEDGNTMLHMYLREGYDERVKFLLDRGADLNARNKNMATPMHMAAMGENYDCLKLLTDRGGDLGVKDGDYKTPIDYARNGEYSVEYARVLNYLTV